MGAPVIAEALKLTKAYGKFIAVDQLDLRIEEGEIYGFLGPNGAGKTTTILMLLGLTEPTSGTARVCGYNSTREALKVKRLAGYLPERVGFYEDLTARQNLKYTTKLNGQTREYAAELIDRALDIVKLSDMADKEVGKFSRGMKQRLGIADVLIKEPKIVFLDEPTAGIDPEGIDDILDLILKMVKEQNITVVISSHQLPQMQKICTRVGIMSHGHLVVDGTIDNLGREALGGGQVRVDVQVSEPTTKLVEAIKQIDGVVGVERVAGGLLIACDKDLRPQIAKAVVESGSLLVQMNIESYTLEEIYKKYFREG